MTGKDLKNEFLSMTAEELVATNQLLITILKMKREQESFSKKLDLKVGMEVTINHQKVDGIRFKITAIKRTKVSVVGVVDTWKRYDVPIHMITPIHSMKMDLDGEEMVIYTRRR